MNKARYYIAMPFLLCYMLLEGLGAAIGIFTLVLGGDPHTRLVKRVEDAFHGE